MFVPATLTDHHETLWMKNNPQPSVSAGSHLFKPVLSDEEEEAWPSGQGAGLNGGRGFKSRSSFDRLLGWSWFNFLLMLVTS